MNLQYVLIQGDTYQLVCGKNFYRYLSSINLIYAGDKSQGASILALKLSFMKLDDEDIECVSKCIYNIGHIGCGKDSYQLFKTLTFQSIIKR